MGAFKKGDRVRVTFEGTVVNVIDLGDDILELKIENDDTVQYISTASRDVEKVEPPVEVFAPGTVVRQRETGVVRLVTEDGWWNLHRGEFFRIPPRDRFTSKDYERVEVH